MTQKVKTLGLKLRKKWIEQHKDIKGSVCPIWGSFRDQAERMIKKKKKPKPTEYAKIMDALNIIDEFACYAVHDNSEEEEKLAKAYNKVASFINKHATK